MQHPTTVLIPDRDIDRGAGRQTDVPQKRDSMKENPPRGLIQKHKKPDVTNTCQYPFEE